jgi:hypothetical protein
MQLRVTIPFFFVTSLGIAIVAIVDYLEVPLPFATSAFAGAHAFWIMFVAWLFLAIGVLLPKQPHFGARP